MNHARIEQVGSPTELYDTPATEFVMSFVGQANRLGDDVGAPPRPRDHARTRPTTRSRRWSSGSRTTASTSGVELVAGDGEPLSVQLTRERLELLELERDQIVWVRADRERLFA